MTDKDSKRKRIGEINKEIQEIKEARDRLSQDYLNDKISFDEYKKRLKEKLGYYDIDKRLLELYDEKKRLENESFIEIHSSKVIEQKEEVNQTKAKKNLPKKKRIQSKNIIVPVIFAGLIILAIIGFRGFRESGITGYFALDINETPESLNQTSTTNQSSMNETLYSENVTEVEISDETENIEEINITKNAEENGTTEALEEIKEDETSEGVEEAELVEGINQTINETEEVIEETINETTKETDNETRIEITNQTINLTINQTEFEIGDETINITNSITNITEITNITNEEILNQTIEEIINETINETILQQENITENITINQTINETIEEIEGIEEDIEGNETLEEMNQTTNETINETIYTQGNITGNLTINQTINETINATINDTAGVNESINQSINQSEEMEYEINITSIKIDNKSYFIDARKNITEEYDLRELLNTTASLFIATGTNTTEVNVVGTILTIFSDNDEETDLIKVKSLLNDSATEHRITIRYDIAENITFDNLTMPYENETTEIITNYIKEEVRLGDYESAVINLVEHFNLNKSSNFVSTTTPAIDSFIANNKLIVTLFKPEKIENYKEEIKLYHEENNSLIVSILNISLTRDSPFIKRIGSLETNQSNISINPYEYLKTNYTANVSCLNNYFEIVKEDEKFVFINQRNLPLRDICFLEALEEESRQVFEISMSVGEEIIQEEIIEEPVLYEQEKEGNVVINNIINKGIVFSQRKEINLTELQTNGEISLQFENSFSPDSYEVYLVIADETNESLYFVEGMTLRRGGITGAFTGNGFAGKIATALTNFFMRIINFFTGGITGFFASDINQSDMAITEYNETAVEEAEEKTEDKEADEGINTIINETSEVFEEEFVEENDTTKETDIVEEIIMLENETLEENDAENETESVIDEVMEEIINETTKETDNETRIEITNQTINQTINQTESEIGDETINITNNITNITEITNITNEEILNQTIEEMINETKNETINETIEEIEGIEEDIEGNETLEEINQTTNETIDETIEEIQLENKTEEIEERIEEETTEQIVLPYISEEINSLFISNNNTLIVEIYDELIETLNNNNLTDSNKKYFIEARFIANGFSYDISKATKDNFTDEFILEIENPYHYDFTNLSLIVNLTTDKREISCRNPIDIIEKVNNTSTIQINEINLPRRNSIRIQIVASSPTFDYEVENLDSIAKILITRREGNEFFIDYILKDSNSSFNISYDINASCGNKNIEIKETNDEQFDKKRLTFDADACNSTIEIDVSKKNITGLWIEHNGYKEYIDLSDRILLIPEEIFLRGNCIECLSRNVCDPLTICPQSNSGAYGWDFVADLIFNTSTIFAGTTDKEIEKAELCLFNTYASTNQEIIAYITSEENSSCQPLYEDIKTELDSENPIIKKQSQEDVVFKPHWLCTDVKEIIENSINNSKEEIVLRIIGQDMNNSNQPFMCFDAGLLSKDSCDEASPEGCLPYLSISYSNE